MKKLIQRAVVAAIGAGSFALAVNAAELRFNNPLPESRPETKELMKFAEDEGKNSGGAVTVIAATNIPSTTSGNWRRVKI